MPRRKQRKEKSLLTFPPFILFLFILLVIFSATGLDYIAWKKGEKSFIFSAWRKTERARLSQESLEQAVLKSLASLGVSADAIQHYWDKKGEWHIMIDLPLKKYWEAEFLLQKEFKETDLAILEKEEQQGEEKNYYLWQMEGKQKQRITLLFSCPKEKAKETPPVEKKPKKKVAIIVDDMGQSLKAINDVCSLKKPLTISILPFSPLAREVSRIAHQNDLEVMLHLPLESVNSQEGSSTEGIVRSEMSEEEIAKTVRADLEQVPYIVGVNNHMGSKITADEKIIRIILQCLKERNLYFIDSLTTSRSKAYKVAQRLRIRSGYRHIFLDAENEEPRVIRDRLMELFRIAQRKGEAIGICHPYQETLEVLRENLHLADKYNVEIVPASRVVH
jgi:hypothetical protein